MDQVGGEAQVAVWLVNQAVSIVETCHHISGILIPLLFFEILWWLLVSKIQIAMIHLGGAKL